MFTLNSKLKKLRFEIILYIDCLEVQRLFLLENTREM